LFHRAANQSLKEDETQRIELAINILEKLGSEDAIGGNQFVESISIDRRRPGEPGCQGLVMVRPKGDRKSMER
jgi:hypothetical protein